MIGILVVLKCRVAFNKNILHEGQYRKGVGLYLFLTPACGSLSGIMSYRAHLLLRLIRHNSL